MYCCARIGTSAQNTSASYKHARTRLTQTTHKHTHTQTHTHASNKHKQGLPENKRNLPLAVVPATVPLSCNAHYIQTQPHDTTHTNHRHTHQTNTLPLTHAARTEGKVS